METYFPDIADEYGLGTPSGAAALFERVCDLTAEMIVHWMRVGFVHGVMNTDNMSIHGLTIDYGPYGWLDDYDPEWTPNTTDAGQKRYRYSQQPNVALWNLYQLANALYPLIEQTEPLEAALGRFQETYQESSQQMMADKLGLLTFESEDQALFSDLESIMTAHDTDSQPTLGFIGLGLMGGPIASALLENGFTLHVFGRRQEVLDEFERQGATVCSSPAEVARAQGTWYVGRVRKTS